MRLLITGAQGFIGKNLVACLHYLSSYEVAAIDREHTASELAEAVLLADMIVHLAGVNRPQSEIEFQTGNVDLTAAICGQLLAAGKSTPIIFASSTQAELENPYGLSKRQAEGVLADYARQSGAGVLIFRLTNVFGKWCRTNYNSVVATFCHNIAHDLSISISDPSREVEFVHVDDVINCFIAELTTPIIGGVQFRTAGPTYLVTLKRLEDLLISFRESRKTLVIPDLSDSFVQKLHSTFLAYLEPDNLGYDLVQRVDPRGSLAEFLKSPSSGQIFVSRTKPGITRGNHFHHLKFEKFLVLEGQALIRFRHILGEAVIEYSVDGEDYRVIDIPPGYTHSIKNVGQGTLVTLFWASEIFDPQRPDTVWEEVIG